MAQYKVSPLPLDPQSLILHETIFHNANGYLGVRANFEEGYPKGYGTIRGQYINGFYDFASMPQAEKLCGLVEEKQTMLNIADTQGIRLMLDGEEFSMFQGTVLESSRTLDMKKGITVREVCWESPRGKRVKLEIKRMTSFAILPLFLIEYKVTPLDFGGKLSFCSTHKGDVRNYSDPDDPRVAGESFPYLKKERQQIDEGISFLVSHTSKSGLEVCSAVKHVVSVTGKTGCLKKRAGRGTETTGIFEEILEVRAEPGEEVCLYKYTVVCDSIRYEDTMEAARRILRQALGVPVEELYRRQEAYLAEIGEDCALEIRGDEELNEAVHYNMYQLLQSVGKDPHSNIAAKGLSGEGYEGHYFWDTEMYIQPFFLLTQRESARNLIRYRYTILDHAKENARILGHKKGAAYPWRTIMGKECSGYFPSGAAQYHINGDIAYAVVSYYLATKDLELIRECGAELLIETSRLWMDLGNYYQDRFHINGVTGPDEYTCLVNNNYYTNVLAQHGLRWAVKFFGLLKEQGLERELSEKTGITPQELHEFAAAAEKMYLPYDERLGINPQDDSFLQKKRWDLAAISEEEKPLLLHYHPMYLYRFQVCKQADTVLAHFILEDAQDQETIRKSFAYYEKVTVHDSSLSACIYSIMASRLGLKEKACAYFGESAKLDLFNTHKNTKDGIHTANMGGTYMAIVYGFGGLRIKEKGLFLAPSLPETWDGYRFRILFEDAKIEIEVSREDASIENDAEGEEVVCNLTLLSGPSKRIYIYEKLYVLAGELEIRRQGLGILSSGNGR
ncbi:MAG: family 65 glycosyl hydrolase [Clostridium sp.]|jgi:alpha,alpha-trehalose phosphorylase|nr:family 65 glycosyl hydrolase [Clostridium sp.]